MASKVINKLLTVEPTADEELNATIGFLREAHALIISESDEVQEALMEPLQAMAELIGQWYTEVYDAETLELELQAEALKMSLSMRKRNKPVLGYLGSLPRRFSEVFEVPRTQIKTRPELFQGRLSAYSKETYNKIMREGYDKSQGVLMVWQDPDDGKYITLNHSRWAASEDLFKAGDKSLKTMPIMKFNGTLEEAIDFAVLESNRSGTAEGLLSDLNAYRRAVATGKSEAYMLGIFKTPARLRQLQDLSHLNPKGRFLENLDTDSAKSFPFLERNAQWAGILRRVYPTLTDSHEREIWDYLYGGKRSKEELQKEKFFAMIEKKVMSPFFKPEEPLNLNNKVTTHAYTQTLQDELAELNASLADYQAQRDRMEEKIARAKKEGGVSEKRLQEWAQELSYINQAINRKLEQRELIKAKHAQLERNIMFDLFNPPPAPKVEKNAQELEAEALILSLRLRVRKAKSNRI